MDPIPKIAEIILSKPHYKQVNISSQPKYNGNCGINIILLFQVMAQKEYTSKESKNGIYIYFQIIYRVKQNLDLETKVSMIIITSSKEYFSVQKKVMDLS